MGRSMITIRNNKCDKFKCLYDWTSISTFVHGNTKRFLHVDNVYVNKISEVKLQWSYVSDPLQTWIHCWNHSCNKRLYVNGTQISLLNNYPEKYEISNIIVDSNIHASFIFFFFSIGNESIILIMLVQSPVPCALFFLDNTVIWFSDLTVQNERNDPSIMFKLIIM